MERLFAVLFAVFFMYLTLSFVAGHVFGLDMYFVWTTWLCYLLVYGSTFFYKHVFSLSFMS